LLVMSTGAAAGRFDILPLLVQESGAPLLLSPRQV
jgi:hypothetical protein